MAQQERKLPFGKIEPNSAKYFYSCAIGGITGKMHCFFPVSFLDNNSMLTIIFAYL